MTSDVSKERTRNYLYQIKGSVVYKAVAILASFLAIPLMIRYLGQAQFGVWSTLLSVMSWVVFFDLGVGNGLRNKVAEALARNDKVEAANFIASGYSLIGSIALMMWALVTGASFFVPWQAVFNTQLISEGTLRLTVQVAVFFVFLNFWIGLICAILGAVQKTAMTALGQLISNTLALALVFILTKTTDATITNLAFAYGVSLATANIGLSLWFYKWQPELRPRPYLNKHHVNPLLSIGLRFFTIQIAGLIIFTTDKMLITQLLGPEYVTQYDVAFKLFSLITIAHTLISAPLWSAYTDAYHRGDTQWVRQTLRQQLFIFAGIVASTFMMVILINPIATLWIGHEMEIEAPLAISIGLLVLVSTWNNIFAMFVNGIGEIKPQFYTSIMAMIINIPLAILLVRWLDLGLSGIALATTISLIMAAVVLPIQVYKMLRMSERLNIKLILKNEL